jgi:protein O-mannosyl-transferase
MSKPKKKTAIRKTSAKPAAPLPSSSRTPLYILAGILLAVFLSFRPVLKSEFLNYDDDIYITENPYIQNLDKDKLKALFSDYYFNQYSPVAMVIMAAQVKAFGNDPAALKLIGVLLHLANTLLVFLLVRLLFQRNDYALIAAAFFGLHPMQVESVAWLTASMKIGTYTFFSLAALIAYMQYLKRYNMGYLLAALGLFVLSCFSKEQAIALSVTLLAIDYLKDRTLWSRRVILEKIPFLLVSLIFGVVTLSVKGDMQSVEMAEYYTAFDRLIFSAYALSSYAGKLLLPMQLSAFYTYPVKSAIPWFYFLSPVLVAAVGFALYYAWKKEKRTVVFGILFFLFNIFLTILSQIMAVRDVIMADRYVYVPVIGFALLVAWSANVLIKNKPGLRTAVWAGLAGYLLLLAVMTWQRAQVWQSSFTVFSDAIEKGTSEKNKVNPFLALAYNNRGIARKNSGDLQGAMADYEQAIAVNANFHRAWLNRANIRFNAGQYAAAIPDYDKTLELDPGQAKAYSNRGAAYAALNQIDKALPDLDKAIELEPNFTDARSNRALVHYNAGQFEKALADLDRFLQVKPADADIINFKGLALQRLNRMEEAEREFTRSIQLEPKGAFYHNRSLLYNQLGRKAQALEDALKAKSLGANVPQSYLDGL